MKNQIGYVVIHVSDHFENGRIENKTVDVCSTVEEAIKVANAIVDSYWKYGGVYYRGFEEADYVNVYKRIRSFEPDNNSRFVFWLEEYNDRIVIIPVFQ
jgi:hypothetical protein